jgi:hypothetical protein
MIKNITKADHAKGLSETISNISGNLLYICSGKVVRLNSIAFFQNKTYSTIVIPTLSNF